MKLTGRAGDVASTQGRRAAILASSIALAVLAAVHPGVAPDDLHSRSDRS